MSVASPLLWVGFIAFILAALVVDLGVLSKEARGLTAKEALVRFAIWVSLAVVFNVGVYFFLGHQPALEFMAGYLLEESLSVDNIFVIVLVFKTFRVPGKYQHRVLFWGILGAVILRGVMIVAGTALIQQFHWLFYVFGAFLIITGLKLFFANESEEHDPSKGFVVRQLRRVIPSTQDFDGQKFFTKERGRVMATPLFLVLVVVEFTDVIFALDSIPAVFGVTTDPFIVFTSNIFAILGLRTLYFLVSGMMDAFRFLRFGLAFILTFIGAKMCADAASLFHVSTLVSLSVIAVVLAAAVLASWLIPEKRAA